MSEKKVNSDRPKVRRHRKSEINLALFLFQASYQGHHQDLSDVLFSDKIKNEKRWLVLNARDAEGMPILINCLKGAAQVKDEKDHLECIKILLSTGIPLDSKDASERTAIHWAVLLDKYEICRYLLQQGAQADLMDSGNVSPLHIAISKRSQSFAQLLCEFGSKNILEAEDHLDRTPLCHALLINSTNVFEQLVIGGCDVNGKMNDGKTLVVYTVEKNLVEFLEILLKHETNLHPHGVNIIHLAACQKESSTLDIISRYCSTAKLDSVDNNGKTALMLAVGNESYNNTLTLLNKNVNTKLQDAEGNTALHFTSRNLSAEIVDILLKHSRELLNICNKYHRFPINNAVSANNRIVVRALLDHGSATDVVDGEGHTLLHYAAEFSSVACLAELASVGLSLNVPDQHGIYPIHYAVRLDASANINTAVKIEFLKQLVAAGVNLNVADDHGLQPIHWAVCMGFYEALKILLIEDANVNSVTKDEQFTPLHLACNSTQFECLELLLSQPTVGVDQVDSQGRTPLHRACGLKDPRFTEALLNAGANPEHQDKEGKTPAHIASTNCTVDCLWLLSLKRSNFDVRNNNDETPIHLACKNADDACVRFLLTRKCNVNATQKNGLTALHIAVTNKNAQKTGLLLQNGAKWNQIYHGKDTITPLDIALENGDYKCIKLLQSFGARTAHSILTQSAITIQHAWKKHRKKKVALGEVPFHNTSSIYTSSNASESVSTKGGTPKTETPTDIRTRADSSMTGNESSEIQTLHGLSTSSQTGANGRQHGGGGSTELVHQNGGVCNGCPDIPQHLLEVLSENSRREFQEKLTRSDREIVLMRELMKETEQLLVRAKRVTEEADGIANSAGFRNIKKSNKEYMEEKRRKQQQLNSKHKFLERLIEEVRS